MIHTLFKKNSRLNYWILAGIAIFIILVIGYCTWFGKGLGKGASIIPNDVTAVVAVNLPGLAGKIDFNKIQQSDKYQAGISSAIAENPIFAEIMRDPAGVGINYQEPIFIAYTKNPTNTTEDFTAVILTLSDAAAFEQMVNKSTLLDKRNNNSFNSIHLDRLTTVGWNTNFVIFGAADVILDLDANLKRFFETPFEKSVARESTFAQVMEQRGDVFFWVSTTAIANDPKLLQSYGLSNIGTDIIKGNHIIGQIDFGKGKVTGEAKFLFKPALALTFNTFFNDTFEADFSKYISAKNRTGVFFTSINLSGLYNYMLVKPELKGMIEGILEKNGIPIKDVFRTFGGDFMMITYEPSLGEIAQSRVIATKVYYPEKARNYLQLLAKAKFITPVAPDLYATIIKSSVALDSLQDSSIVAPKNFHLLLKDDLLFMTADENVMRTIMQGGYASNNQIKMDIKQQMKGNLMCGQMDFSDDNSYWESFNFQWNKKNLNFELTLKDKDTYALEKIIEQNLQ